MAKDTLTLKLQLEADFQTIQTLRRTLAEAPTQQQLLSRLTDCTQQFLQTHSLGDLALTATLKVSRPRETTAPPTCPPPLIRDGIVTLWDYELDRKILEVVVDGPDWSAWLAQPHSTSFRYHHPTGAFTAIRENRQGRQVWYAHRRLNTQLKRFYLGISQHLTAHKLALTADKITDWIALLQHDDLR